MRRFLAGLLTFLLLWAAVPFPAWAQSGAQTEFTDLILPNGQAHWASAIIEAMAAGAIVDPSPDGKFRPDDPVTRQDFALWLARILELSGSPETGAAFKDWSTIPEAYRGHLAGAVEAGLIQGYPDGTFKPQNRITRLELATLIGRALERLGEVGESRFWVLFGDTSPESMPAWSLPATIAVKKGVIRGKPVGPNQKLRFDPQGWTSRAEALVILQRFMEVRGLELPAPPKLPTTALGQPPFLAAYYVNTDYGYQTLTTYGRYLDLVVHTGLAMQPDGTLAGILPQRAMDWYGQNQKPVLAMVQSFNRANNRTFLTNPKARQTAVQSLVALMDQGFVGVNLDFENLDADLRPYFTQFVEEVQRALKIRNKLVTLSVMAKTADMPTNSLVGAYDYKALGQLADYVMIMTYDYHWSGGPAGPIAPMSWVRNVLKYAVQQMPSQKIFVGIPTYAYGWPEKGRAYATAAWDALKLAASLGVQPLRHPEGELYFTAYLPEKGQRYTYYFHDAQAIADKVALVKEFNLAGAIMWRLGFEPAEAWPQLRFAIR